MKKNIIIAVLVLVIIILTAFIFAGKRIVIRREMPENTDTENTTSAISEEGYSISETEYYQEETAKNTSSPDIADSMSEESEIAETVYSSGTGKTVVIDPGHQSRGNSEKEPIAPGASEMKAKVSSGTTGRTTGVPEYAVNLQVALKLRDVLQSQGYNVVMTREVNEIDISNSQRAEIANKLNADAFVRIHCNGDNDPSVNGALTMCQTSANVYCGQLYSQSRRLSESILNALCAETGAASKGIIETDTMSGINWCQVPVTIVEMGFMTNSQEDRLLNDSAYQDKLATGIAKGINAYFG